MVKGRDISRFVKNYRDKTGYSQLELAKLLGYSSGQYISNIERGADKRPVLLCRRLMKFLTIDEQNWLQELVHEAVMEKVDRKMVVRR